MQEAIAWLEENGTVAIYCEAIPEVQEPSNPRAEHRKKRGFPVLCGNSNLHVTAILVAIIAGPCKNLSADNKCLIYDRRPLVCQIYPAEISPFVELNPANKVCPPEAWPLAEPADNPFRKYLPSLAEKSRLTDYNEASRKGLLCAELGINTSALADEGYVRHIPDAEFFLAALKQAWNASPQTPPPAARWQLLSRSLAADPAHSAGLDVIAEKPAEAGYLYLRA
jgi:Fe-S-cluster containining protein